MSTKTSKRRPAALVTGASQRIGKSIALALAAKGYDIALHYNHSKAKALQTAKEIQKHKVQCELFQANLSDATHVTQLIPQVTKTFPKLTVLVNNASIFEKDQLHTGNINDLDKHMTTNFQAPYQLSIDFAKKCKKGHIINILDTHIVQNTTHHLTYLLSKKALAELTQIAAIELAPHIRVNGIAPGLILPPPGEKRAYLDRLAKRIPLKKKGNVNDVTKTVAFLMENPYITGQIIFVDGGEHLV